MDPNDGKSSAIKLDNSAFKILLENSTVLTVVTDRNGTVLFATPQSDAVIGHPATELLGRSFPDIVYPDDETVYRNAWQDFIHLDKPLHHLEYRILDREGRVRWISHAACPLTIDGDPIGIQNNLHDITKRKKKELSLLESKQFNDVILNASPDVIHVYDIIEKKSIYSNESITRTLGYTADELKAFGDELVATLMHPEDFQVYAKEMLPRYKSLKDGEFLEHEFRIRHKSGHWCWLAAKEAVFRRTESGAVKQIFGLVSDTSQKREAAAKMREAQQALEASENKYRRLFENMNSAFALHEVVTDENGIPIDYVFLEINDEFEKMTGLKRETIIGKPVTVALPGIEKDSADWLGKYGEVALGGKIHRFVQYSETLSKWYTVVAYCPTPRQFATIFLDITEQKQLENRLIASEKMQAIGQLAGGIAHDFNNQLAGIVGYADMLMEDAAPGSETAVFMEKILLATKRATDLTAQLLAFARKGKYLSAPVDLRDIISETVDILKHTIDRRIQITQAYSSGVPRVIGDPSQLQNALMNLALNARDAMPEGGELRMATDLVVLDERYCECHPYGIRPGRFVELSVMDNGCGMSAETKARMFEPFFTTKEIHKGTGMGLAAVYGTIKNHGGAIDVYSEPGLGTTVRIYLPYDSSFSSRDLAEPKSFLEKGCARILLVDDEPMIVDSCRAMLKRLGYSVQTCCNGKEALALYAKHHDEIDVVILDMVMPDLDGRETHRRIRGIDANVLVLLSSGYSLDGIAQEMLDEGVDGFIQKPFRMPVLAQKLAELTAG